MKNRIIKFRAWDKKRNNWVTGRQPDSDDLFLEEMAEDTYVITNWGHLILEQFTGLYDKNGKEI